MSPEHPSRRPSDELIEPVYDELRRLTQALLRGRPRPITLQATAIVHEAYLRLANQTKAHYNDERHFLAVAAQIVRRVIVDLARERQALKRGGGRSALTLESSMLAEGAPVDVLDLHEALELLSASDSRAARVVELRYFGGLTTDEIAGALDVGHATVERDWRFARAWLFDRLYGP